MAKLKIKSRDLPGKNVTTAELQNPAFAGESGRQLQKLGGSVDQLGAQVDKAYTKIKEVDAETKSNALFAGDEGYKVQFRKFSEGEQVKDLSEYYENVDKWLGNFYG